MKHIGSIAVFLTGLAVAAGSGLRGPDRDDTLEEYTPSELTYRVLRGKAEEDITTEPPIPLAETEPSSKPDKKKKKRREPSSEEEEPKRRKPKPTKRPRTPSPDEVESSDESSEEEPKRRKPKPTKRPRIPSPDGDESSDETTGRKPKRTRPPQMSSPDESSEEEPPATTKLSTTTSVIATTAKPAPSTTTTTTDSARKRSESSDDVVRPRKRSEDSSSEDTTTATTKPTPPESTSTSQTTKPTRTRKRSTETSRRPRRPRDESSDDDVSTTTKPTRTRPSRWPRDESSDDDSEPSKSRSRRWKHPGRHRHKRHPGRHWWWGKGRRRYHDRSGYRYGWSSPSYDDRYWYRYESSSDDDDELPVKIIEDDEPVEETIYCGDIAVILSDNSLDKLECLEILANGTQTEFGIPDHNGVEDEFLVNVVQSTDCDVDDVDGDDVLCIDLDQDITAEECGGLLGDVKTYLEDNLVEECQVTIDCGNVTLILSGDDDEELECLDVLANGTVSDYGIPNHDGIEDEFAVDVIQATECSGDEVLCLDMSFWDCEGFLGAIKTYLDEILPGECKIEDEGE